MAQVTVVNTRRTPFIVDDAGHVLAGGDRGPVDGTNPRVIRGLASGALLAVATTASQSPVTASEVAA